MAWVEQIGAAWRVRFRIADKYRSVPGFLTRPAAEQYARDVGGQRPGTWTDLAGAATKVADWVPRWMETLDVETRTEENYRGYLRNHILPRWGRTPIGQITASAVTLWLKQLRTRYAASTVTTIRTVFSMLLDDAIDEHLITTNPVRHRRRRGRRLGRSSRPRERVWALPEQVVRIATHAATLGGPSAQLLIITAGWTGCRWGELAGLCWRNVDLDRGSITIDPDTGALHESAHQLYLGPPKTPASARTISLPGFGGLHQHRL